MTFWRTWVHESLPQDYKMKMADVNLTCEDLLERAAVSSSVDHPLMIEQVRSLPAACINISPDFSLKRQDFFASEIWICGGENLDLSAQKSSFVEAWMSEAFRRRQLFSFHCCAPVSRSLQNSFPIKARNENKGRNIRRQAVSIKPHSRLTNKVGVAEKQPNAWLSQYLNILD